MNLVNLILPTMERLDTLGYWVVFFISLLESIAFIGFLIPGTLFLVLVGFLTNQGVLNVANVIWFAILGAVLGDAISFYLGWRGISWFNTTNKLFNPKYLVLGEKFFAKHGGKSVFLGRFVGPIRSVIPFIAGALKMKLKDFFLWNIASAILWSMAYVFLGLFFGQAWQAIEIWVTRIAIFITCLILALVALYLFIRWLMSDNGKRVLALIKSLWFSVKQAILSNAELQTFVRDHSSFFNFFYRRLNWERFHGLPFTLLFLFAIYIIFVFLGLTENIINSDSIVVIDVHLVNFLARFRDPWLLQFFSSITLLGKWWLIAIFTFIVSLFLWYKKKQLYLWPLWLALGGSEFFVYLAKKIVHRPRPLNAFLIEDTFAFPSGHASVAMVFYGLLAYIIMRYITKWRSRLNLAFLVSSLIIAIGFSRLYLGVHYLSDVLGGYLVGLFWLVVGISFIEWKSGENNK